ncbi:UDP-N-acetylmuramoyl-tripeptide--D-alanyl-D-alanine ligase [Sedimentitalea sp. XS_ASV28]|uniref:UDP-N-acetylmuramoyl-tripeptide--D-alanyl-D- alanine ligase n=1 Tax=Sedimentitalea sp. XS_ASV28 TaxID=3241296 RepID=UPI003517FCF2
MTLWTAGEAAAATGGQAQGDWAATGVSIDTRSLQPGDLFVALRAARDGHDFVAQALDKGASAALVTHVPDGVAADAPLLVVEDVQQALEGLGRAARARTRARVVAVTGSVGKTSTKEMLARMLGDQGRTHASVASYNNHWGVPLTLARMPRDTEFAVIEIGMNHPGEIEPLARMARPHVAMITTVAAVHLEAFADVAEIAAEKAAILDGLEPGGTAILNADIDTADLLRAKADAVGAERIDFGTRATRYRLLDVAVNGDRTIARATVQGEPLLFKIATAGRHFAMNGLGALAATTALGADAALAVLSLGRWSPYQGRGVREIIRMDPVETDHDLTLLDDAYNANPTSVAAALEVLAATETGRGRRIAILGDMKELGPQAPAMHAALAELPAMARIDTVHCVGPLMASLHAALPPAKRGRREETGAAMLSVLRKLVHGGDVVLVKGSLSMKLSEIVDAIRKMGHGEPDFATQDNE